MSEERTALVATGSTLLPSETEWRTMAGVADALVRSGLLPAHVKTPQAALAIMLKGRELGVPPMHALSNIVVVQGKPTCNAELMLALIYRDQGDEAVQIAHTSAERCALTYRRRGWKEAREYAFTMADARTAGLTDTPTWKKYPAAMLRARAISAVARMAFPDSIAGMYGYEELGVSVEVEDGQVVLAASAAESEGAANGHNSEATLQRPGTRAPAAVKPAANPAATSARTTAGGPTVTAPVPQTAPAPSAADPNAERPTPSAEDWPRSAADWSGDQLRQRIEESAGKDLKTGPDWKALARAHGVPEPTSPAELGSRTWLLGLYQAMRAQEYQEMIASVQASDPDAEERVNQMVAEALSERNRRGIGMAHYDAVYAKGEARKAELSAPLLSGPRAQVAS